MEVPAEMMEVEAYL